MTPYYERNGITIYNGDCLEVMKGLPNNYIDTVITDPPYELNFMNKKWDGSGIAFNPEVWREALRVAKPGATLMAFGGTRTYHRLACAIEDAGWEIRDCISYFHDGNQQEQALMASLDDEQLAAYLELHYPNQQMSWVYGSGIGLGHNLSKGIDKAKGMEREVVGEGKYFDRGRVNGNNQCSVGDSSNSYITAPASPLAKKFDGWNSRLKPSFEPIIVAMAPLDGTYAQNAERWAVSGLWIDGGRIPTNGDDPNKRESTGGYGNNGNGGVTNFQYNHTRDATLTQGRYPANTIHSNEPGVLAEFDKAGASVARPVKPENIGKSGTGEKRGIFGIGSTVQSGYYDTSTSVARYFAQCPPDTQPARFIYNAKAPKSERKSWLVRTRTIKYNIPKDIIKEDGILCKDVSMVLVELLKKVTLGLIQKWSIDEFGESIMGQCPQDSLSTILTEINKITESEILNWLMHSRTNESIADANSEMENGGSLAENAESSKLYQQIITRLKHDHQLVLGVKNVALKMLSEIKKEGSWEREIKEIPSHPTQKPLSLIQYLCRLTKTPTGGVVLDLFGGGGTTALACIAEGRECILIEKNPPYVEITRRRIAEYTGQEIQSKEVTTPNGTTKQMSLW